MNLYTRSITLLAIFATNAFAQQTSEQSAGAKGDAMFKQQKFTEAIKFYDLALAETKADSAENIIKIRNLIRSKGLAYFRLKQPDQYRNLIKQQYELLTKATKKYPNNLDIAKLQIIDLGTLANQYRKKDEFDKKVALQLQAISLAQAKVQKHPTNQSLLLTLYNTKLNLAKSYRWNKKSRPKTAQAVEEGLSILEKIEASSLPKWTSKEFLMLQLVQLQVATLSLNKKYDESLKLSTQLLDKTKPLIVNQNVAPYQLSLLANAMYHNAFMHEKLGRADQAQRHLKNLLKMLDNALVKFPNNPMLTMTKKTYTKSLGKPLK